MTQQTPRSALKVLFAGTPQTAVPALEAIVAAGFTVPAVLTRPDAPVGRKRVLTESPVAVRAGELGLPVLKAARLTGPEGERTLERIAALQTHVAVVVAYGALVPGAGLSLPHHGWLNLHFSLLPAYRGAAPVQHAVINGEDRTGACVFGLEEGLDTGPVYEAVTRPIGAGETAGEILEDLSHSGAHVLVRVLSGLQDGTVEARPQTGEPSYAPKLTQADGQIDPARPADEVAARINGTTPEPGAWAELVTHGQGGDAGEGERGDGRGDQDSDDDGATAVRVKLIGAPHATEPVAAEPTGAASAGTLRVGRRHVDLVCADGLVRLDRVQPAGKKPMSALDWARGQPARARFQTGGSA